MKISTKQLEFFNDNLYSNSFKFKPIIQNDDFKYISKIGLLKELVNNKSIIHVGCVDHNIETIENKIKKNKWLHKHLEESSSKCLGIDIKEDEILYIKKELGYRAEAFDITQPNAMIENELFDILLLPDVIEHIGNPVDFLKNIRNAHKDKLQDIIITVPNAFYKKNFLFSKDNCEIINSDHRFWFTPYTICKILIDAGFEVEKIWMYNKVDEVKKNNLKSLLFNNHFIRKYIYKNSLFSRLGIVVRAKF